MKHFTNCILLFILCLFYFVLNKNADIFCISAITSILFTFIILTYTYFIEKSSFTLVVCCIYGGFALVSQTALAFFPIVIYCLCSKCSSLIIYLYSSIILLKNLLCITSNTEVIYNSTLYLLLYIVILCVFSIHIYNLTDNFEMLIDKSKRYRDDSTEINLLLKEKNKNLLINQNYEINNATLTERNRIAREIHDNVGHILSRAIMITGAIKVVNKNENLYNSIDNLEECLSNAMTNIRESVHNLHNNSISLQNTVQKIVDDFKFCNINLTYDMTDHIPNDVKYAFITIIKESLTNIEKHSNATSAKLTLREHPAMYQLIIHDNGSIISEFDSSIYDTENYLSTSTGIGLNNIYSRIHMLKGTIKIYTDNGFCIFISVPKGEKHEYSNS